METHRSAPPAGTQGDARPLDDESRYRAVTARDVRFDGLFFTAVSTTGIYCRPVCPARTPRRSSCTFYQTAAAAERAGFRPCLRCRPELSPGRPDFNETLAQSILARLQAGALDAGSVETLARDIGLSSRQIRRILLEHFGVTPIEVAQTQRLLFAKKLLQETALPMTQVALSSGFGSLRRFNAAFAERYGMAPSALRREGARSPMATGEDVTLRLSYRPPLAWPEMLDYLAGRATLGVEQVVDGAYWRTVALDSGGVMHRGWLRVRPAAQRHAHLDALEVTLSASLAPVLLPATHRLRALFDLDCDPERIAAHLRTDPALSALVDGIPGLRMPGAWDAFELALRAVLGQQVSVAGATTVAGRLAERFGEQILTPHAQLTRLAPTAARLAAASESEIATLGMPGARARTVIGLARFAADGGMNFRPGTTLEQAVGAMVALPGIGPWTAQYVAMRALRHPDAFPAGDLGLRKALGRLEVHSGDHVPAEAVLLRRSGAWRPWRAYAAAYLWRSLHSNAILEQDTRP